MLSIPGNKIIKLPVTSTEKKKKECRGKYFKDSSEII